MSYGSKIRQNIKLQKTQEKISVTLNLANISLIKHRDTHIHTHTQNPEMIKETISIK